MSHWITRDSVCENRLMDRISKRKVAGLFMENSEIGNKSMLYTLVLSYHINEPCSKIVAVQIKRYRQ